MRAAHPKRCLFIVHRELIARKLKESFEQIIDEHITTGLFTSGHREIDREYVLANVQILVKNENLHAFAPDAFDHIIIYEAHHAGAKNYQKMQSYFKPKFLLGMTATPEVVAIEQPETLNLLFIKKSDAEGSEFYFMGEMLHKQSIGTTITGNKGEKLSIVQMFYEMKTLVEAKIYDYFEG